MTKKEIKASQAAWVAKTFRNLIPLGKRHIADIEWEINEQDTNPGYKLRTKCEYSKQQLKERLMESYKLVRDLEDGPEPLMD
jgi:hypothetical protein